ncbi:polyhomeotic-like protein 1 isoform X6 [Ahaetulla prasina]|uniref:polyhomeotic-like protein 1 isoform X6 n=1 Tax=Ahaetulla prasina TaxID=499056 RepID=UPI002647C0C7|nr:polyhomeotic-like protein 1 isoform X6 [Ahaetulla prasina]
MPCDAETGTLIQQHLEVHGIAEKVVSSQGLKQNFRQESLGPDTMETESEQNSNSASGSSGSGGSARPQISQMTLYERQAVQALQALQRQPNAAQYFHQFMLQQQLNSAQLHSLAAVQQATIAASRQAGSPNTSSPQQTATTQASINLATTSAAQLISRSQSVSSPGSTTLTQSVLLGNTTSPPLNQSQAQMYLRPQLGNLLQVNRTLGRNVPLTSQLILMPNGAVAAVQQESPSTHAPGVQTDTDQVQNLAVRSQQTSVANASLQASTPKATLPGNSQSSVIPQAAHAGQTLTVTQASSGNVGQSLNLSQGAGSNGISGGMASSVGSHATTGLNQSTSSGPGSNYQRKGTGVVQPLPVPSTPQAVTVSQGSQTEADSVAAKKAEGDGNGQQTVGMNLTRTATPAPSQTLISSATYTQIQPHSLIQQQQQIHLQKQVVIQQQIAIHHQQPFQHRQSQLLHTATHLQLAQQQQQAPPMTQQQQGSSQVPQQTPSLHGQQQAQTLVVQPMLQSQLQPVQLQQDSHCQTVTKTPVPIQSKPPIASLKPPQIGAAKMSASQQPPPHIPVQVVGNRQQGSAQALGLPQINTAVQPPRGVPALMQPVSQTHTASSLAQISSPSSSSSSVSSSPPPPSLQEALPPLTSGANVAQGTAQSKPQALAIKRKAESEEEREDCSAPSLQAVRSSPVAESPKFTEDKGGLGEIWRRMPHLVTRWRSLMLLNLRELPLKARRAVVIRQGVAVRKQLQNLEQKPWRLKGPLKRRRRQKNAARRRWKDRSRDAAKREIMDTAVQHLLNIRAVELVLVHEQWSSYYSMLFIIQKASGGAATNSQPERIEQVCEVSEVQDALPAVNPYECPEGGLLDLHRPYGGIPSCSDKSEAQEVPEVLLRRQAFAVPSASIRPCLGPQGFYEDPGGIRSASQGSSNTD